MKDMSAMININTHLKGVLVFSDVLDIGFLLIFRIWHYVQKGSGSILISMYFQTIIISLSSGNVVNPCPNLWCNNSRKSFFLGICFNDFGFSLVFTQNECFICALCRNITAFYSISLNKTVNTIFEKGRYVPSSLT